jgi:nitrate reductase molybdenum cofactor assembly chaperone NarJ/NarW
MFSSEKPLARTLRVLARLLSYPDADMRQHIPEMRLALRREDALSAARLRELDSLMLSIEGKTAIDAEADYVQLFDSGRSTSLHLFEHVHGDSRDRGPAMVDLAKTYELAGLYLADGDMPDHLPVALEYASTQPPREARSFLAEMSHILNSVFNALVKRDSRYASALGALLELAGETARPVDVPQDQHMDEAWAEPPVFGGCSTLGQERPQPAQPIKIYRTQERQRGHL